MVVFYDVFLWFMSLEKLEVEVVET